MTSCSVHVWIASHIHVKERLEFLQYAFQSIVSQTRKPDSIWLSISCVSPFEVNVKLLLEELKLSADREGIDFYCFFHPSRLHQFEHFNYIWNKFKDASHKYNNPYITFSDDDDLSHPDRLATYLESNYSPFIPTFCRVAHFDDSPAPGVLPTHYATNVKDITEWSRWGNKEYAASFCSLFLVNKFFTEWYPVHLQNYPTVIWQTDMIFVLFISKEGQHMIDKELYFAREDYHLGRAYTM